MEAKLATLEDLRLRTVDVLAAIPGCPDIEVFFDRVCQASSPQDVVTLLRELRSRKQDAGIDALIDEAIDIVLGGDFPAGTVKRELALFATRAGARDAVLDWLKRLDEDEMRAAIYIVASAVEHRVGGVLSREETDVIVGMSDCDPASWAQRSAQFASLAEEIVALRVAHPDDVRTRNLMRMIKPRHDIEGLCAKIVERVRAMLEGSTAAPSGTAAVDSTVAKAEEGNAASAPDGTRTSENGGGEANGDGNETGSERCDFYSLLILSKADAAAEYFEKALPGLCHVWAKRLDEMIVDAKSKSDGRALAPLLAVRKRLESKGLISPSGTALVTADDLKNCYCAMVVKKYNPRTITAFLGFAADECFDVIGVTKSDSSALERLWEQDVVEYETSIADKKRNFSGLQSIHNAWFADKSPDKKYKLDEALNITGDPNELIADACICVLKFRYGDNLVNAVIEAMRVQSVSYSLTIAARRAAERITYETASFRDIAKAHAVCESRVGNELFERCGRELVALRGGTYRSFRNEQLQYLAELEQVLQSEPFVSCEVLHVLDQVEKLTARIVREGLDGIHKTADDNEQRGIAEKYAILLARLGRMMQYRTARQQRYYRAISRAMQAGKNVHGDTCELLLEAALCEADFPDFVCRKATKPAVAELVGRPADNKPLRMVLEAVTNPYLKEFFMLYVTKGLPGALSVLPYMAGDAESLFLLKDIMSILLSSGMITQADIASAMEISDTFKEGGEFFALTDGEQAAIKQALMISAVTIKA